MKHFENVKDVYEKKTKFSKPYASGRVNDFSISPNLDVLCELSPPLRFALTAKQYFLETLAKFCIHEEINE